jgi:hypothetical protein
VSASKVVVPTPDEIRRWPATVRAVPDASSAIGVGPDAAYKMIRAGEFPFPILRLGRSLRVTRANVMATLGIPEIALVAPGNALANGVSAQVGNAASDSGSEGRGYENAA